MAEYIEKKAAISEILGQPPEAHYPTWYAEQIKAIPPADVRPVVRGEWKPMDLTFGRNYCFCSACEMTVNMPTVMGVPVFRYCPYCGAETRE